MRTYFSLIVAAVFLLGGGVGIRQGGNLALAQTPQPQPPLGSQLPNLKPVALVNVALDGVARPIGSSPTGTQFAPEFFLPRSGVSKTLQVTTKDGRSSVQFSYTLPSGAPANALTNSFVWQQTSVAAPNAVGRLNYNGCQNCPSSFTIIVKAEDPSGVASGAVKFNLTASTGRPSITSITRNGGTNIEPRFEIRFAAGTFDPADSEAVGVYAGNLKYRLIPEGNSNFAGGSMFVIIPRLKAARAMQVLLRNPYGSSSANVSLPIQPQENDPPFECVNCSTVFGNANIHDAYSIKHSNTGTFTINGTDEITLTPLQTGATPCDQRDFIYTGANLTWLGFNEVPVTQQGTVTVSTQPPPNALLRSPQNRMRIAWTLNAFKPDRFYQIVFRGIDIVGVCSNRVVQ